MKKTSIKLLSIFLIGFSLSLSTSCEIIEEEEEDQIDNVDDNQDDNKGTYTDIRDGRVYNWVRIGDQVWMTRNLDYYPIGIGPAWVANGNTNNRELYGLLYFKDVALQIAPDGWHLPSIYEWEKLERYVSNQGFKDEEAYALKSTLGWDNMGNGVDYFGFNALPAGAYRSPYEQWEEFVGMGEASFFWIRTLTMNVPAYIVYMEGGDQKIIYSQVDIDDCVSIRCVRD